MAVLSIVAVLGVLGLICRKYIWLYLSRKPAPRPAVADLLVDPVASKNPQILLAEANRLAWVFNWPKAEPLYVRTEELFKERGDTRNEVYARVGRIRAQSETMSWVDVSQMLGQHLEIPVVKSDPRLRLWCLAANGYTDLEINPPSAKRAWTEAQQIAHTLGETQWEARAEGELGIIAFLEGNSRRGVKMVGDALLSAMASGDVGGQVRYLEMLGNGFIEMRRYGEALASFNRAIRLTHATPDSGFPFMAFEGKSQALVGEAKLGEAREALNEALAAATKDGKFGHEAYTLVLLGQLELQTGDRERAKEHLEEARQMGAEHKFYRTLGQAMIDLAELYREEGDLKSAEERAAGGVAANRAVGDRFYLPRDLTVLADLKALRGHVAEAETLYEDAEDVVDGMLVNVDQAYLSTSLAAAMSETYLHHFRLLARQNRVERALGVLERVRGRTVAALLENKVSFSKNLSPEAQDMANRISELQLRLMRSEDGKERTSLLDQLAEYEARLAWPGNDQGASRHKWFEKPAPLKAIQGSLRSDELVLEFVLDEPQAFCLWISRTDAGLKVLGAGRQQIEELTRKYLDAIRDKRDAAELAKRLYDILVRPVAQETKAERLVVVPDGLLYFLPFDTLRDSSAAFLVLSRTVSYAPAATVLNVLRTRKNGQEARRVLLAVGDVLYRNQGHVSAKLHKPRGVQQTILRGLSDLFEMPMNDLPETREEVLSVSRLLGKDAVLLLGSDATETAFKSEPLEDFKIIHLAAHGFADTQFPERSALVLGVDPTSRDDGLLQVREINRLRFNADLVTLSACDTGIGKVQGEEGVTNLVEAFLVSGAKAVVASLWSADDTYTLALMERFYSHIAQGQDKAAALRQAKLDLLAKYGRQVPPYYWGAFVLVGDGGSPIRLNSQ
jgi:CHAT domain-containing protein